MATAPLTTISAGEMLAFFFLLLGPIKILGPFVKLTRGAEPRFGRQLAVRGILLAAGALGAAAIVGERFLDNFRIGVPVLAITGGLILFLAALDTVMQQFRGPGGPDVEDTPVSLSLAVSPLAFPTIVTPSGIAAVIIFVTLSPDLAGKLTIGLLLLVILILDLIAMWYARAILKWLALPLYILGVVLGVIQVALGLNIILVNLSRIGVFPMTP
jgi:multiple antibiotic resistance protein